MAASRSSAVTIMPSRNLTLAIVVGFTFSGSSAVRSLVFMALSLARVGPSAGLLGFRFHRTVLVTASAPDAKYRNEVTARPGLATGSAVDVDWSGIEHLAAVVA